MLMMKFHGLGGVVDDLLNNINPLQNQVDAACRQLAVSSVVATDHDIDDVEDNWKPTGFYTPQQVRDIVMLGLRVLQAASAVVDAGILQDQLPEHRDILNEAHARVNEDAPDPQPFINGARQAEAAGPNGIVEAKGLKRWVVEVLKASRAARLAAAVVECARPQLLFDVVNALDSVRQTLVSFVKAVVQVVKTAASIVAKVPDVIGSLLTVLKFTPWILLGLGAYYGGVKTGLIPSRYDPMELRHRDTFRPWRRAGS